MFNIPPLIVIENPWWFVLIAPAFAGVFIGIILWIINTLDKLSATHGWFGVEKITAEEYSKRWKANRENLVAEVESGKPLHEIDVAEISPQTLILRRLHMFTYIPVLLVVWNAAANAHIGDWQIISMTLAAVVSHMVIGLATAYLTLQLLNILTYIIMVPIVFIKVAINFDEYSEKYREEMKRAPDAEDADATSENEDDALYSKKLSKRRHRNSDEERSE